MEFRDQTFKNQRINVDGNHYTGCTFNDCTLVFAATQPFTLSANRFNNVKVEFVGAAGEALNVLRAMYHGGFKQIVEDTFNNIRRP